MSKNISRSSSIFSAEAVRNADLSKYKLDLNLPMDWEFPLSSNRGDKFRMNGFIFLDNLYLECEANGNSEDERKILAYMLDFAMQNPVYDKSTQWPWHDDATANRLLRWCLYYMKLSSLCLPKERELLEKSLAYQAELLFSDEFYTPRHNHGMHQDQALILYAVLYGKGDQQRDYIAKALARTGEYLDFVYTSDGVHKEHSPLYPRHIFTSFLIGFAHSWKLTNRPATFWFLFPSEKCKKNLFTPFLLIEEFPYTSARKLWVSLRHSLILVAYTHTLSYIVFFFNISNPKCFGQKITLFILRWIKTKFV